jgi:hypothetical protein
MCVRKAGRRFSRLVAITALALGATLGGGMSTAFAETSSGDEGAVDSTTTDAPADQVAPDSAGWD